MDTATNAERADRALRCIEVYGRISGMTNAADRPACFRDLLADMMHYAKAHGLEFDHELHMAVINFDAERGGF